MLHKVTAGKKPATTVRALASKGRNGDTELAHMTPGEIVVPIPLQTPPVMNLLHSTFAGAGVPLERYTVAPTGKGTGNSPDNAPENPSSNDSSQRVSNSINPETGMPEYSFFGGLGGFLRKAAGVVLPIAGTAIGGPIGGAIGGAIGAKLNGGNPLIGGITGGLGGLTSGAFSTGFNSSLPWLSQVSAGTLAPNAFTNPLVYSGAGFAETGLGSALKSVSPFLSKASKATSLLSGGGSSGGGPSSSNGGVNITSSSMSSGAPTHATSSGISGITAGGGGSGGAGAAYDSSIPVDMIGTGTDQYAAGDMVKKNQSSSAPALGVSQDFGGGVDMTSLPWQQPPTSGPKGAPSIMDIMAGKSPSNYWQDAFQQAAPPQDAAQPVTNPQTGLPQFALPVRGPGSMRRSAHPHYNRGPAPVTTIPPAGIPAAPPVALPMPPMQPPVTTIPPVGTQPRPPVPIMPLPPVTTLPVGNPRPPVPIAPQIPPATTIPVPGSGPKPPTLITPPKAPAQPVVPPATTIPPIGTAPKPPVPLPTTAAPRPAAPRMLTGFIDPSTLPGRSASASAGMGPAPAKPAMNTNTGLTEFAAPKVNPSTNIQEFNIASEFGATLVPTGQTLARNAAAAKGTDTSMAIQAYDTFNTYLGKALTDTGIKLPKSVYFRGGYNQNNGGPYFFELNGENIPVSAYDDASMYNALTKIVQAGGGDAASVKKLNDWYTKTGAYAPAADPAAAPPPPPTPIQPNPVITPPTGGTSAPASQAIAAAAAKDAGMQQGAANQGFNVAALTAGSQPSTNPNIYTPKLDPNVLMNAAKQRAEQQTKTDLGAPAPDGTGGLGFRPRVLSWLAGDPHQQNPATQAQEFFFKEKTHARGRDMPVYKVGNITAGKPKGLPATARRNANV